MGFKRDKASRIKRKGPGKGASAHATRANFCAVAHFVHEVLPEETQWARAILWLVGVKRVPFLPVCGLEVLGQFAPEDGLPERLVRRLREEKEEYAEVYSCTTI